MNTTELMTPIHECASLFPNILSLYIYINMDIFI